MLQAIKQTLRRILPVGAKVLLFGSQARNEAGIDSDWDVLILLDKEKIEVIDYNEISYSLFELGWEMNEKINPILYTLKEWDFYHFTLFYKNVEQDSIRLI